MRVDFNVPMKGGKILDDTRIRRVIPGLKILANSAKQIFLITHFGRPKGAVSKDLSVQPCSRTSSESADWVPRCGRKRWTAAGLYLQRIERL